MFVRLCFVLTILGLEQLLACLLALLERRAQISKFDCAAVGVVRVLRVGGAELRAVNLAVIFIYC